MDTSLKGGADRDDLWDLSMAPPSTPHRTATLRRRGRRCAAAVLGLALVAAGCGGSNSGDDGSKGDGPSGTISVNQTTNEGIGKGKPGGAVVFGLAAESDGYKPAEGRWAGSTYIVGFSIMDPLAAYDVDLQPKPYLAKDITSNADFTEWTLTLRPGINTHNSKPVDAELVKKNLDAQKDSALTGSTLSFVKEGGITMPDGPTGLKVVVSMTKPWSTFPHILTAQVGAIADAETIDSKDGGRNPKGSGPFIFDDWVTDESLRVHKNPGYWRKGYPYLENIEFKPMADIQSRQKSLAAGDIQIFETNDANQIIAMEEKAKDPNENIQMFTDQRGNPAKIFVGLNMQKEPFNDFNARAAVAYAGDTPALSEQSFAGIFPPAFGPFSEGSKFFTQVPNYPKHDVEKAKEYAKKYSDAHGGKPLEFSANITASPEVALVAQVLKAQMAEAGIIVNLETMEQIQLIIKALSGDYQATGFILFGSPHLDREYVFIAGQAKTGPIPEKPQGEVSLNFTRIGLNSDGTPNDQNKPIVEAMDKARTTLDFAEQKKQYDIVQEEMSKNLNFLFLVGQSTAIVFDKRTHGALKYSLPNADGGDGVEGMVTVQTFTFNLWVD